jgi:aryl-alcohol dehydrogenase-like predicted oxidoreductase
VRTVSHLPKAAGSHPLQISELGFGCAAVGGSVSRRHSLRALSTAFEAGITLYDTARSYGYGTSESILADFLIGRRDRVVVCTKFGILPARAGGWKQRLKPAAQFALQALPQLRPALRRQARNQIQPARFSMDGLHASLETSLRELRTDYVDILLMHAAPISTVYQEDLLQALERLVECGKVRVAGISGDSAVMERYFAVRPVVLTTAQFSLNPADLKLTELARRNADLLLVANHPFGGAMGVVAARATVARLHVSTDLPATLREKLDPRDTQVLPELLLNCCLRGTGVSAVVAAMMREHHLRSNVQALAVCRFSESELSVLRQTWAGCPVRSSDSILCTEPEGDRQDEA